LSIVLKKILVALYIKGMKKSGCQRKPKPNTSQGWAEAHGYVNVNKKDLN
jgi:hypothetical protein